MESKYVASQSVTLFGLIRIDAVPGVELVERLADGVVDVRTRKPSAGLGFGAAGVEKVLEARV